MNGMKLINDLNVKIYAVPYHSGQRHGISASKFTKSVIQRRKQPHSLHVKVSGQRQPYKFIEAELLIARELIAHLIALFHQHIDLIQKIKCLIEIKSVINPVVHGFRSSCRSDPRITS